MASNTSLEQSVDKMFDDLVKSRFIEMIKSKNYPLKTIGESCVATRVGPFGSALHKTEMVPEGPVFVLGTDNAVDNEFKVYEERYISSEKYSELERYTVVPGDIIITMMGTIGRSAVIPENFKKSIISSHLSCLSVDTKVVLPEYLQKCMVLDHDVSKHLDSNKKGSIMSGLNLKIIKAIPFSCPPINVQKQFMTFVEQVDKSKFIYKQLISRFDYLVKSRFIEMLNNAKVDYIKIKDLVNPNRPITYGILKPGADTPNGVPLIRGKDYTHGIINETTLFHVSLDVDSSYKRSKLESGDLIFAIRGSVGHSAIIPNSLDGANITQDTARVSLREGHNRNYILAAFNSDYVQNQVRKYIRGATIKGINLEHFREVLIPVPSLEEQNKIAEFIRQVDKSKLMLLDSISNIFFNNGEAFQ